MFSQPCGFWEERGYRNSLHSLCHGDTSRQTRRARWWRSLLCTPAWGFLQPAASWHLPSEPGSEFCPLQWKRQSCDQQHSLIPWTQPGMAALPCAMAPAPSAAPQKRVSTGDSSFWGLKMRGSTFVGHETRFSSPLLPSSLSLLNGIPKSLMGSPNSQMESPNP